MARSALARAALLAVALVFLCPPAVFGKHFGGESEIVNEHNRISLIKHVSSLSLGKLNSGLAPNAQYSLGNIIQVSHAIVHRPKTVVPRGISIDLLFEATKKSTSETAWCRSELWETLEGEFLVLSVNCDYIVKPVAGYTGANKAAAIATKLNTTLPNVRSAAGAYVNHLSKKSPATLGDATNIFVCHAAYDTAAKDSLLGTVYYVALSLAPNCTAPFFGEIRKTTENEYFVIEPVPPLIDISAGAKVAIAIASILIWGLLFVVHDFFHRRTVAKEALEAKKKEEETKST